MKSHSFNVPAFGFAGGGIFGCQRNTGTVDLEGQDGKSKKENLLCQTGKKPGDPGEW